MGMYLRHWRCGFWACLVMLLMWSRLGSGYTTNDVLENATRPAKVKAFVACRKECIQRCDTLVYRFERNQYHCHKCLDECMRLFLKQADSVGVVFGNTGEDGRELAGDAVAKHRLHHVLNGKNSYSCQHDF